MTAIKSISAVTGLRSFREAYEEHQRNLLQQSTGKRINRAADDAAGLGIAQQLSAEIRSLEQASRNIDYGAALADVADGGLESQGQIVGRLRELATQAANGTLSDDQRQLIQTEVSQLTEEIDRIAGVTEFAGQPVLAGETVSVQVGTQSGADNQIDLETPTSDLTTLGLAGLDVSTQAGAESALSQIDSAIQSISTSRADLGAAQNRLTSTYNYLGQATESAYATRSRIEDADIAQTSTDKALSDIRHSLATRLQAFQNVAMEAKFKLI